MPKSDIFIIAPHADDELIGCFELLKTGRVEAVLFPNQKAVDEAYECARHFDFKAFIFHDHWAKSNYMLRKGSTVLSPDSNHDFHPEHRYWGQVAEGLARKKGVNLIWYSTNMNAPYIREVADWETKKELLNKFYPQKSSLWEYDHRYFLFEGQCKWIFEW